MERNKYGTELRIFRKVRDLEKSFIVNTCNKIHDIPNVLILLLIISIPCSRVLDILLMPLNGRRYYILNQRVERESIRRID